MQEQNNNMWTALAFASLNAVMIAGMSFFAKLLSTYFGPIEVTFFRNIFSLVALVGWLFFARKFFLLKTKRPWAHFMRAAVGTFGIILGMTAISVLTLAETTVLMFTSPLFTLVLSILVLKEKVGPYRIGAILFGFLGILVIANPFGEQLNLPLLGLIAGIGWGFSSGTVDAILRWMGDTENSTTTTFYFTIFGVLTTALHWPFADTSNAEISWHVFGIITGLGGCGLIALLAKSQSYRLGEASLVAPVMYTMIIWSVLFDYLVWDKVPSWTVLLGAAMIIGSNLFIIYRENTLKAQGK